MTCILSDDSHLFVLLLYLVNQAAMQCNVKMESWDGSVLDINATCSDFGQKCLQLPGMLTLSHCDATKEMTLH